MQRATTMSMKPASICRRGEAWLPVPKRTKRDELGRKFLPVVRRTRLLSRSTTSSDDADAETERETERDADNSPSPPSPSPSSVALSSQLGRRAGEVFVLAGFLKILIVCFPFSTMAISMYFQGLCDLGYWAALKMFPIAIGMLALAKVVVDRRLHERRFAPLAIVCGGILALLLSRWAFARPRPSPLDPMLAHYNRSRAAEAAAAQRREQARQAQSARKKSLDPPKELKERAKMLRDKGRGGRFS